MNVFLVLSPPVSAGVLCSSAAPGDCNGYGIRRKLAELMAHHLLGNGHVMINLAVVHLELEADKVRQDGSRPRLCPNGRDPLSRFRAHDWESRQGQVVRAFLRSGGWMVRGWRV